MVGRTKSVAEVSPLALSDLDQMFPETTPPAGSQRGGGGGGAMASWKRASEQGRRSRTES